MCTGFGSIYKNFGRSSIVFRTQTLPFEHRHRHPRDHRFRPRVSFLGTNSSQLGGWWEESISVTVLHCSAREV